jgi:hypothetical protein
MNKDKAFQLYETWTEQTALHRRMGQTILELLAHPDSNVQQIQQVQNSYRGLTRTIIMVKPKLADALLKAGHIKLSDLVMRYQLFPKPPTTKDSK